jgi:hypothetical protein
MSIVWVGLGALFLIYEGYALATKEEKIQSLSRTIWNFTAEPQVTVDFWIEAWPGGKYVQFTMRPLRWPIFGIMAWATIHLSFGECAFGLC